MNTEPMKSGEIRKDAEPLFSGVSKEEYESYTSKQRYLLATGNGRSLQELDEQYGVITDIPDMEEFEKSQIKQSKKVSDMLLGAMKADGSFDYLKKE